MFAVNVSKPGSEVWIALCGNVETAVLAHTCSLTTVSEAGVPALPLTIRQLASEVRKGMVRCYTVTICFCTANRATTRRSSCLRLCNWDVSSYVVVSVVGYARGWHRLLSSCLVSAGSAAVEHDGVDRISAGALKPLPGWPSYTEDAIEYVEATSYLQDSHLVHTDDLGS